tara:strand:- start:11004 stop:11981 length:978 start_codon:yes stop_codon:yes gene_type:complete
MHIFERMTHRINGVTWPVQMLLFCTVFWVVTAICSVPDGTGVDGFTRNQCLEDFGVFLMFLSIWCGFYAHFHRNITLTWLLLLFAIALTQEEYNLFNLIYQAINAAFGRVIDSTERQRGDVIVLALVAISLLIRLYRKDFRSFFRIHITAFLWFFTTFLLWVHAVFPYQMQGAILAARIDYQKEFTSTYPGRFQFYCDLGAWECYSWVGDDVPEVFLNNPDVMEQVLSHKDIVMNTTGQLAFLPGDDEVFRGIDTTQKYILTYYKNHDLNRVVIDRHAPQDAADIVTLPMLIFSTSFGMVWFFGGLLLVFMHQSRSSSRREKVLA